MVNQPGNQAANRFVAAAKSDKRDLLVIYAPEDRTIEVKLDLMPESPNVTWVNPRTGERSPAVAVVTASTCQFPTPAEGDWILFMKMEKKAPVTPAAAEETLARYPSVGELAWVQVWPSQWRMAVAPTA